MKVECRRAIHVNILNRQIPILEGKLLITVVTALSTPLLEVAEQCPCLSLPSQKEKKRKEKVTELVDTCDTELIPLISSNNDKLKC